MTDQMSFARTSEGEDLRRRNEEFWDELCGTAFARGLGLVGHDRATLEAFDRAYIE